MCAFKEPSGPKGSAVRSTDAILSQNGHAHPALKQLQDQQFGFSASNSRPSSSHGVLGTSSPLRSSPPGTPDQTTLRRGNSGTGSEPRRKHGKRNRQRRPPFGLHRSSQHSPPTFYGSPDYASPGAAFGRHLLSRDNKSLQNLTNLGRLVDDRTGFHEDKRVSEEELQEIKKRKNGKALKEYYEQLNATLDGWREVDEILDSKFPEEVMLRFGSVEEVERFNGTRKRLPWIEGGIESEGTESGYQEESEESEDDEQHNRRSGLARAASALSGLWFGSTPKTNNYSGGRDEESALISSSVPGTPDSERRPRATSQRYGATNAFGLAGAGLTTIKDAEGEEGTPASLSGLERSARAAASSNAGTVRSTTPSGQNPRAIENGVMAAKIENRAARSSSQQQQQPQGKPRLYRRRSREDSGTDSDDEFDDDDEESDQVAPGKLDAKLAAERTERKARAKTREASLTGMPVQERDTSTSASRERKHTQPGGISERDRMRLLQHVPGRQEREGEREKGVQFAININMAVNVLLLAGKAVAVISSNSVSLIASLVDSALDLLSTVIIFGTSKAISYRSFHTYFKYPVGKKRFEPLGVVIFAVLMIASFCQVLVESVERLFAVIRTGSRQPGETAALPFIGIAFMVLTIVIKTFMWLIYRKSHSSGVRAVAQDAENDVVFNIASLIFPVLGSKLGWPALDPIGGICLSIYIIVEWIETLTETMTKLTGAVGSSQDVSRALYLILRFRSVNSVSALEVYHAGDDMIVEADIVLPYGVALKEAHDAGEIVCYSMEMLSGIERAYIHLDYNPVGQAGHVAQRG